MPPSSRGLGHFPFTEVTGIRIPLGVTYNLGFDEVLNNIKVTVIDNKDN